MVKRSPNVTLYRRANKRAKSFLKKAHKLESTFRRRGLSGGADAIMMANSGGVRKDFSDVVTSISGQQIADVQHQYAIANGRLASLQTDIESLQRHAASGVFDPTVSSRISKLIGEAVQVKSELAAMEQTHEFLKSVAASGGARGMADYAGLVTTAQSLGLRDSQKELMQTAELAQVQTHVEKLSSAMSRAAKEVLTEKLEVKRKKKQDEIKELRAAAMMRANELLATDERYAEYAEEQREKEKIKRREAAAWGPEDVKAHALREELKELVKKEELKELAKARAKELVADGRFTGRTGFVSGRDEEKMLKGLDWESDLGQRYAAQVQAEKQDKFMKAQEKAKQKFDKERQERRDARDALAAAAAAARADAAGKAAAAARAAGIHVKPEFVLRKAPRTSST